MSTRHHATTAWFVPRALITALLAGGVLALAACGGSSSSGTPGASLVTGVVASGAPMANAWVTLTDANGKILTTQTASDGTYHIDVTGLVAPLIVRVSGISADAQVDLTSMLATAPVAGQILQLNVTPLTNAIAALLSHNGDPAALSAADVNSTTLTQINTYIANALAGNTLGYAGDPIATPFSANGSGYDGVLDNLAVIANPGGSVSIIDKYTVASTSTTDDSGEMASAPTPAAVAGTPLTLTKNTDYTVAATKLDGTAIALPGNNLRSSLGNLQTAFNQCFAVPAAQRGAIGVSGGIASYTNVGAACANFVNTIATNYLNNGLDAATQFSTPYLQSSSYDNAVFDLPYVVRYVTPTKAIVHESWTRSDGLRGSFETIAVYNSNNVWQLAGNQRNFAISIQPIAEMRQDLNTASGSVAASTLNAYSVGLNVRVNMDTPLAAKIMWAQVTGRGLGSAGNGALLMPQTGCGHLTFVNNNASGYAAGTASNASGNCDSYYRLAGVGLDGSTAITWPASKNYAPTALAATDLSNFTLFEPYTFHIHYCSSGALNWSGGLPSCSGAEADVYYVERLSTLMPTLADAARLSYPAPDPSTLAELTPGGPGAFAGGATLPVAWNYGPKNYFALPVDALDVQIADGTQTSCPITEVNPKVPFSASLNPSNGTRNATATATVSPPSGSQFPSASTISSANSTCSGQKRLNMVKLSSHRKNGLQIQSVIEYANY